MRFGSLVAVTVASQRFHQRLQGRTMVCSVALPAFSAADNCWR